MVGLLRREREILQLPQPQGDDLNCRMRRLGGDEKRGLVAVTNMFTGIGAVFVKIALEHLYPKEVRGGCFPGIRSCEGRRILGAAVALSLQNSRSQPPTSVGLSLNCPG